MATASVIRTPQVLTDGTPNYAAMNAALDRIEAKQQEAAQRNAQHEQRQQALVARIEAAQRLAQQMIAESEVR